MLISTCYAMLHARAYKFHSIASEVNVLLESLNISQNACNG